MYKFLTIIVYALAASLLSLIPLMIVWKFVATGPIMTLSEGVMQGNGAKLSYKGWIWKTHEGWLPIGLTSEGGLKRWHFTVKDGDTGIINCINSGNKVKLTYIDYVGMPYRQGSSHQVHGCEEL